MRVLGRYMKMPAKPRKKPMSLSAFKKKVGCMLDTISKLESTERTEAYGYLQNCVNVLGVHKLGLNQTDIANLMARPESSTSSKEGLPKVNPPKEVVEPKLSPIKEVKPTPSTSSSIQVSVISRNERANVINYSKSENHSTRKDSSPKSLDPPQRTECSTSVPLQSGNYMKETQSHCENVRETVVSSTKILQSSERLAIPTFSPDIISTQDQEDVSKEKGSLISCVECGAKLKSRRAMLAHLDRHVLTPISCRACRRSFNCLSALKFHFEDFCTSQSLVCPQCEEVFSCRTHFNNHVEGHNRNNCQMCPALFTNRKNLVVHMADAHNVVMLADAAFTCSVQGCERRFVKRSTLHRHLQLRHTSEGQLVCITCGAFCEGEDEFRSHSETHKQRACGECSESFTRRQQYLVHMASHETSKYKCITCDQVLPTKARVLEHRKDGHQVEGLSVDFACDKCEERFHTSAELRDHSHVHKPPNSISCKYCHKTFSTKKICHSHMRSQHGVVVENGTESSLICEQCGKQFRSPSLLAKHLKGVHNEQVFSCNFCNHKTNKEVNMRRHRALHTSQEQQFVCDQCGASFQALSNLKDHNLFVHSDERNVECNVCHKLFKRKNDLRRHQRSHSDDRKYVCHCKQAYKFMSHLRRHQEAAHKTVTASRIVQRLVKDSSGNLMEKPKPTKAKKLNKDKKHRTERIDIVEAQEQYVDEPVPPVQHDETRVQLISVNEDDQVVAMSVSDLPIADQHVDPYSLPVAYDGLSYSDPKAQLVYTTPPPGAHVMSLQLPQFELVEPMSYDTDTVMDMSTTSHADLNNHHSSMLMSITSSEPSSQHQPVMTLITGLEHNSLFTTQADIGTMTEHSNVYSESLLHHAHGTVSHVKSVDSYSQAHILDPKTSQADISTMTDMYSVYEAPANLCVNQHQQHQHHTHELPPLNYPLDPCHSILLPTDQTWHIHPEASNLAQYSTC